MESGEGSGEGSGPVSMFNVRFTGSEETFQQGLCNECL